MLALSSGMAIDADFIGLKGTVWPQDWKDTLLKYGSIDTSGARKPNSQQRLYNLAYVHHERIEDEAKEQVREAVMTGDTHAEEVSERGNVGGEETQEFSGTEAGAKDSAGEGLGNDTA